MRLKEYIAQNRPHIEKELVAFVKAKEKEVPEKHRHAHEILREFSVKGKMLRGVFVILAHDMFGGEDKENAIKAAAAVELNQSTLLIHDDVMDNDELRRSEKSVFVQYADMGKKYKVKSPMDFGKSMAVVAGDIGFFLCYELLVNMDVDKETLQKVLQQYIVDQQITGTGQFMDFEFSQTNYEPTVKEILEMYLNKTGRYTFTDPFLIGAILAGADQAKIDTLEDVSEKLGVAFQIKDDELGIFADAEQTGKTFGSDITENKKTIFRSEYLAQANDHDKEKFLSYFGQNVNSKSMTELRNMLGKSGIREKVQQRVKKLSDEASADIDDLNVDTQYTEILQELIQYNMNRGK